MIASSQQRLSKLFTSRATARVPSNLPSQSKVQTPNQDRTAGSRWLTALLQALASPTI
jgi:hypothetical protein